MIPSVRRSLLWRLSADASFHTDLDKVIVDEEEGTVYLEDPRMSLDVGAVAKGFATELVARELEASGDGVGPLKLRRKHPGHRQAP
jgi:hypothetical protein